jgi:hypothetical protein
MPIVDILIYLIFQKDNNNARMCIFYDIFKYMPLAKSNNMTMVFIKFLILFLQNVPQKLARKELIRSMQGTSSKVIKQAVDKCLKVKTDKNDGDIAAAQTKAEFLAYRKGIMLHHFKTLILTVSCTTVAIFSLKLVLNSIY